MSTKTLSGNYVVHTLRGHTTTYADLTVTFGELKSLTNCYYFDAATGRGEQRARKDSHAKGLTKDMKAGEYTPTQHAAGLHPEHKAGLTLNKDGTFTLLVDPENPLPLLDGGHREDSYTSVFEGLEAELRKAKTEQEKQSLSQEIEDMLELPIGLRIYLDGDPQQIFVRLQKGLSVDRTHLLSLKLRQQMESDEVTKLAHDVAFLLNESGPFKGLIKFDSRKSLAPIPLSTLFSSKSSEIATSLRGLARIGVTFGKDARFLADAVISATEYLCEKAPQLMKEGKVLTPPPGGTRGSATMLVGLGVVLAYYLVAKGHDVATQADLSELAKSAKVTLNAGATGNLSGPAKRCLMGEFARHFLERFEDEEGFHEGLPIRLLRAVSASAFDAGELPKERKPRGKKVVVATLPMSAEPWNENVVKTEPWAA